MAVTREVDVMALSMREKRGICEVWFHVSRKLRTF
jgi:hypothetical protein